MIEADGDPILRAVLPNGMHVDAHGPAEQQSAETAQATLAGLINERIAAGSNTATARLVALAQGIGSGIAADNRLTVRSIVPTAGGTTVPGTPIRISGTSDDSDGLEAIVVDTTNLPTGTVLTLNDVDIAFIIGSTTVNGGVGNNRAFGDDANQSIMLGVGDDTLLGGGGNDTVASAEGNDVLSGDDGDDLVYGGLDNDTVMGGTGNDTVGGGVGDDMVVGNDGTDILFGEGGNDTLFGGQGIDILSGGVGSDTLFGQEDADVLFGEDGADVLAGGGNDTMAGGTGADLLFGEDGDDVLFGGAGNDTLVGGDGNDVLFGEGDDVMTGGAGSDVFAIGGGGATYVVSDFVVGEDYLAFTTAVDLAAVLMSATSVSGGMQISLSDGTRIQLVDVTTKPSSTWF